MLDAVGEWWTAQARGYTARVEQGVSRLLREGSDDPLVVAHARKGKLVRLEVHEAAERSRVDALVREFEGRGLWSFNGVVRTVE